MAPVLGELGSVLSEEAGELDEAELGFFVRDGVGWEGLAQVRSDLAHPETFLDENVAVALRCIGGNGIDMGLGNIANIDHSELNQRNTSWEAVFHEHLDHSASGKVSLDQRRSLDRSWINDGQSELLVLRQVFNEVPRGLLRKSLGLLVGADLVIVEITPVGLIVDVRPLLNWHLDDRSDS